MRTLLLTILLMVVILITGCQESQQKPSLRDQLIRLDNTKAGQQWKEAFGDNAETRQAFNLMLLNDAYSKFGRRIAVLEAADPNGLGLRVEAVEDDAIRHSHMNATAGHIKIGEPLLYIYDDPVERDPNVMYVIGLMQSDTVCTKHGRLNGYPGTYTFEGSEKRYCGLCMWDIVRIYLDKHIGVDPNG